MREVNIGPVFGSSDHLIITFAIKMNESKIHASKEKVSYYQKAITFHTITLSSVDLSDISGDTNIDQSCRFSLQN